MELNSAQVTLFRTKFATVFNDAFNLAKPQFDKVAFVFDSGRVEEVRHRFMLGLGLPTEWKGPRTYDNVNSGGQLVANKRYQKAIQIPVEALERDQYGIYTPLIARLGQNAQLHKDSLVFGLLSSMLSDTSILAWDGIAFYGNHTTGRVAAAQFNNKATGAGSALSESSLITGITAVLNRRDTAGAPLLMANEPLLLVVPPALKFTASKLANLSFYPITQPGSGASTAASQAAAGENILKGEVEVVVSPFLSTTTEWHLVPKSSIARPVIFQIEKEIEVQQPPQYFNKELSDLNEWVFATLGYFTAAPGMPEFAYGAVGA